MQIVPKDAKLERVAEGISWAEGPVWERKAGYLLFSDVPNNSILKWESGKGLSLFRKSSGYSGSRPFEGREPGSNGLTFDRQGRLVVCQHGDRRIVRLEKDGSVTTLAERYEGKRFNSPNDLVFKSNGDLYFTDPPFGLPQAFNDPAKELPISGGLSAGARWSALLCFRRRLRRRTASAFRPTRASFTSLIRDGHSGLSSMSRRMEHVGPAKVLFDGTELAKGRPGVADSLKVDVHGNIFAAAPGGIWILSPDGKMLGRFELGNPTGNCAWGEDGSTLFIASNHSIYRIRLTTQGAGTTVAGFNRKTATYAND